MTSVVALLVTIVSVFALFWFVDTFSEQLNVFRFENQSCSCSSFSDCPYSQSCHRLLGTHVTKVIVISHPMTFLFFISNTIRGY
jgi:hypothetical protein